KEFIKEKNIYVVPLNVIINGVSYKEDIDITKEEFYEHLHMPGVDAKTSQPSYGEFIELYEELKEKYDCGIALHDSKELTGTYDASVYASEQTGFPVEVVDSKVGAYALGKMVSNGIYLEEQSKSYEEIVATLKTYPDQAEMY